MTRIAIITGSTRPGRVSPQVAQYVYDLARDRESADYEIVDIADFSLPLYDESVPAIASGGVYTTPEAAAWSETIASFDGYILITPEYNRGLTAAQKNAIDYLYTEWNNKAAGIVSYGSGGGGSAGRAMREVLVTLQVATVQAQPSFNLFTDFENMSTFTPSEVHLPSVISLLDQVELWTNALAGTRVAA